MREVVHQSQRRLSDDAWRVLDCLRDYAWRAPANVLNTCGTLNYRARVSDLRLDFGLDIDPVPQHPRRGEISTYVLARHHQAKAAHLWEHRSLAGYVEAARQVSLLDHARPEALACATACQTGCETSCQAACEITGPQTEVRP